MGFYEDLTKNIFQLSSNMHLISSSGVLILIRNHWTREGEYLVIIELTV